MSDSVRDRLKRNFSTIYITIVSVMLGLALEDLISIVRDLDELDVFTLITAGVVVHVIFNAWVAYSVTASGARLVPSVWDALNVFLLSFTHFGLNSSIGKPPVMFFLSAGIYTLIAGAVVYYNTWRINMDDDVDYDHTKFRALIAVNLFGGVGFLATAALTQTGVLTPQLQLFSAALGLPFAFLWLFVFLRTWKASGLPVWNR